jgi:hypothetical protein
VHGLASRTGCPRPRPLTPTLRGPGPEDTVTPTPQSKQPDFSARFIDVLPVDRVAIATLGEPFDIETVTASDDLAARLSEIQLDLGEGPAWDAHSAQKLVRIPDIASISPDRWPLFISTAPLTRVRAIYSFPLSVGLLRIGAVDLFTDTPNTLTPSTQARASALAKVAAADVLRYQLQHRNDDHGHDPYSRREVHQATGMVIAQMQIGPAEALLLIRAHAYSTGTTVRETAADITARRITLER